jgi:hypothetical protein
MGYPRDTKFKIDKKAVAEAVRKLAQEVGEVSNFNPQYKEGK